MVAYTGSIVDDVSSMVGVGAARKTTVRYVQNRKTMPKPVASPFATFSATSVVMPRPYFAIASTPSSISNPAMLNRKNSAYSRCSADFGRSRKVQCRFMK